MAIEVKNAIKRKPGHLYYIDKAGNVCSTPMKRKKKAAAKKAAPKKKATARKKPAAKKKATKKRS